MFYMASPFYCFHLVGEGSTRVCVTIQSYHHVHLCLRTGSLIFTMLLFFVISLFMMLIGQYISIILLRHLCTKAPHFFSSCRVSRQVSQPYNSPGITLDINILILVFLVSWPFFQIFPSLLYYKLALAWPSLSLMLYSVPHAQSYFLFLPNM